MNESNSSKSAEFRRAHEGSELLILTSAWDGASAITQQAAYIRQETLAEQLALGEPRLERSRLN